MAARRLIIVLVALLAISVIAAAIAPDRRAGFLRQGDEREASSTTVEDPAPPPQGEELTRTISASAERPESIRAGVGDQLALTVEAEEFTEVGIDPLGLLDDASPDDPATFDLLLREPGELSVRLGEGGRITGRILVEDAAGEAAAP